MGEVTSVVLPGTRDAKDAARSLTSGPTGLDRETIAANQRSRLHDSIVALAAENGLENAGIKAICARAGVAPATFYQLFSSKSALFVSAWDEGNEILMRSVTQAYLAGDTDNWEDALTRALEQLLLILSENPAFARCAMVEMHKAGDGLQERVESMLEQTAQMFAAGGPHGDLDHPEEEFVPLVVGAIYARLWAFIRRGQMSELPVLRDTLVRFAVTALRTEK